MASFGRSTPVVAILLLLFGNGISNVCGFTQPANSEVVSGRPVLKEATTDSALSSRSSKLKNGDSWEQLEQDIDTVLFTLRSEELDPSLKDPFSRDQSLSYTTLWNLDTWDEHTSRYRYVREVLKWPTSRLLNRILPQLVVTIAWSALAVYAVNFLPADVSVDSDSFDLSLTSVSLVSGFVAILLTLRSNQGLDRLNEARKNLEKAILHIKDSSTLVMSYVYPKDPDLAMVYARHLAIFTWLLQGHLRETNQEDIVQTMLPKEFSYQQDGDYILQNERNRPVAVLTRLRQIVADCANRGMFRVPQHTALERNIYNLQQVVTACERIQTTPIPPIYTTHTSRLLVCYLACLPFALHSGNGLSETTTLVTTAAVGFAMLGLDEIGHLLEQPFQLMPLYQSAKVSSMDVRDAFCRPLPDLPRGEKFDL